MFWYTVIAVWTYRSHTTLQDKRLELQYTIQANSKLDAEAKILQALPHVRITKVVEHVPSLAQVIKVDFKEKRRLA